MRDGYITPIEFLQKIANIDNKIMKVGSEDDLTNDEFNDSVHSNNDNSSESESDSDEDPSNCIICGKKKIEVLLMPCSHLCCCKMCWEIQKNKRDSKG